ncbi:MAG: EamA family transporter [Novosphingobium pentaromativorans]|uniref:EamA family transporter n=1 Tax=Novosphingobium pentaromativorans TaxID=205844 RepID=A0A2W5NYK1_9SPHN|nr:MAG: EamA family transporter [Novosphingobium pentaromativorans]
MVLRRIATRSASSDFAPLAAVATAMVSICWGASIAKTLFPAIGPAGATALRLSLAAVILCGVFRVWQRPFDRHMLRAALPYGLALGCMNLLFYCAIQRIPLGIALATEFTGPLAVATFSSRRRVDLAWVTLAVAGLALLLPHEVSGGASGKVAGGALDPVGVLLALGAGVFWGAYILLGKRAGEALGAAAPAYGMTAAALVALPFGVAQAGTALLQPHVLATALVVAIFSSAIPYSLEMFALRRLPTKSFGILTSGEPAVGALTGALLMGETLPMVKWLGIAAVVGASIGTTLTASSRRPPLIEPGTGPGTEPGTEPVIKPVVSEA